MKEDVLQYIWKTQAFQKNALQTTQREPIKIIQQGNHNLDEGPDFSSARISIGTVEWIGDVEIHVQSKHWNEHGHQHDPKYNRVILHVVWEYNSEVKRLDETTIPTLELKSIVSDYWLQRYHMLISAMQTIPCQTYLSEIDEVYKYSAFNIALVERLERKSAQVLHYLNLTRGDWEAAALRLLIANFGFKKNGEGFEQLASCVDYKIIRKVDSITQVEAYLFGMAGLLPRKNTNQYVEKLRREFKWIQTKFSITTEPMTSSWWLFMRMRPANFPTLRIAQLAQLLLHHKSFLRSVLEVPLDEARNFFRVEQSEYWQSHYHFSKASSRGLKGMGEQSIRLLSINVVAVLLMAYGQKYNDDQYTYRAIKFLEAMPKEKNAITSKWADLGVKLDNAAESQGAIELYNNYCKKAGCLSCQVGGKILQFS